MPNNFGVGFRQHGLNAVMNQFVIIYDNDGYAHRTGRKIIYTYQVRRWGEGNLIAETVGVFRFGCESVVASYQR